VHELFPQVLFPLLRVPLVKTFGMSHLMARSRRQASASKARPSTQRRAASRSAGAGPAISPDSRHIVFSAWQSRAGRRAICHRPLDTSAARMLAGTEDGSGPFWSPDGKAIGFFAEGKLQVLQLAGNSARVVCDSLSDRPCACHARLFSLL
jgi:hypothetical protein